ncbi:hypothetical protein [Streptomyces sp. TLI_171]|uniref:hypothetical protein n=1 Tax=Streptomyces sp. TLI_171 TaxID=1938859 RepID=UPI000C1A66C1|nr:hypothetical protein [Streptomyces sp. TLI_171]RKE18416.1 hypothetical protein BX266_1706 [Streptomyces sp. TLI_171]
MSSDHLTARHPAAPRLRTALLSACTALLLACAALLGAGAPARAATPSAGPSGSEIAQALSTGPVYVDPSYATAVNAAQQQALAEQIAATGLPIKVALVPLAKGDAFDGQSRTLAAVLKERLGLPELILITTASYGKYLDGFEYPTDTHQTRDAANAVGFLKELDDAGLAARVSKAVELIKSGNGTAVYKAETDRIEKEYAARPHTDGEPAGPGSGGSRPGLFAVAAVLVLAVAVGSVLLVRRRRPRHTAFTFPDAVFAADRAADEAGLRRQAAAEVLALGEAVDAADGATTPGLTRALDAYDAAGRVLDAADGIPDLAGVLALVAEGRAALATDPRLPLCFFDPRHGAAARRTTWRPLGRRERVDVAVCEDCGQALRTRRSPQVLAVRDQGRTVPYFEVPAERSLWAATGYGSLLSGPEDTLAGRVGTGEFSRTRPQRPSQPAD